MVNDNLPVLAALPDACVDLIYLDPPFNSKKEYSNPINIPEEYAHTLYRDYTEMGVKVVEPTFSDQWSMELYLKDEAGNIYPNPNWKHQWVTAIAEYYPALHSVLTSAGQAQDEGLQGYLTFMAVRLLQMRRVLKETGSIYLHCDPTASHYLKAVMDCVFGRDNFRNEIVWHYGKMSNTSKNFPANHDVILRYSCTDEYTFNPLKGEESEYRNRFMRYLTGNQVLYGSVKQSKDKLITGRIKKVAAALKRPLRNADVLFDFDVEFKVQSDVIYVPIIKGNAKEKTGFPTQKPLALLERIVEASSNPGDVVLDPFAGCATACVAAERLERRWIGIEIGDEGYRQVVQRMQNTVKLATKDTPLLLEPERVITRLEKLPGQQTDYPLVPAPDIKRAGRKVAPAPRPQVEDDVKFWLFGIQDGLCIGCAYSTPRHNLHVDHVIPRAKGGPDEEWNYQLLCGYCNSVKGDRLTTQQLWETNQTAAILSDTERVKRLWQRRSKERENQRFPGWPLN